MITGQQELEDLIMAAAQEDNDAAVIKLLTELKTADMKILKEAVTNFDFLFDTWDESVFKSEEKASVCLYLAEHSILDSSSFRIALHCAIRKFLPPYISSPAVAKAVGARDQAVCVRDVATRIRKLQKLKTNAYVFQFESKTWGRIINVDKLVATIAVSTFATGGQISIPISSALGGCYFFEPSMEMTNIIATHKDTLRDAAYYREKLNHYSLGELSETKGKEIVQKMFVPVFFSHDDFAAWWTTEAPVVTHAPKQRTFRDARSILELHTLLAPLSPAEVKVTPEAASKLAKLFSNVRPGMAPKDLEMLSECIALLADSADDATLRTMFSGVRGKVPFWPAEITESVPLKNLEIWGRLPVRLFPGFLKIASILYSRLEIAKLAMILPLRCITIIFETLTMDDISDALFAADHLRSDIILSIWKNRAKYPTEIQDFITMSSISHALSEEGLPKEWTAAQRELKKTLFDKADFQKFILANAGSNIPTIISSIQRMRNMVPGECQSLLVKLARHSDALTAHIESGEGKKLLATQSDDGIRKQQAAPMTSMKSYKALLAELDNIVRVQVPENNKAIEHARGFGDFRENAEYDAAKERRRFLQRRRSELEMLVATVQPINFLEFTADTSKVSMGTVVTLESQDGTQKVYSIVGAWDGNPDCNLASYKTKFGESLLGAQPGDSVTLPDGTKVTVKRITALPPALAKELSSEE